MSIRYGISVIPQPSFTAGVHRARQTLCNQYGCWAAEMHPVHLPLIDYFPCPGEMVQSVDAGVERVAGESPRITLHGPGVAAESDAGNIFLDFGEGLDPTSQAGRDVNGLRKLRNAVIQTLERVYGLSRYLEPHRERMSESYPLRIALMQHANLPPRVFESAVTFAQEVVGSVVDSRELEGGTRHWQLVLIRFESDAAGDDWNAGGWAADLRWQIVSSYPVRRR